jgi:ornithine cyclodeaminase
MTGKDALWLTEADVVKLMSLRDAIAALERGLAQEHTGAALNMAKTHVAWNQDKSTLHAIGAVMGGNGTAGTKTWAHTPGGACPLLVLVSAETGALIAVIEAFALGQMRTAGISGVATRWMAVEDADDMALIGTGKQALAQVAGVLAVRRLKRLRVYSPTPEHRKAFIDKARKEFPFEIVEAASVDAAVNQAAIVTLVTRAREPFLAAAQLAAGCHINAVGAITPERREFHQDVFGRSDIIAVDSVDSVRRLSSEFIKHYGGDEARWKTVQPLSALVARGVKRPAGTDLSLFKAMGMGLSDLALGVEIVARAQAAGAGRPIPAPVKVPVPLV